jgi:uncharacterized protein (DUF2336 family)
MIFINPPEPQAGTLRARSRARLRQHIARRIEMLTRITDLFVNGAARFSEDQIGVFDDVMARLVSTIEAKARAKLAHRLAPIANAPSNVIHMLAFDDDIEVARPVLTQSERLDDRDLLANASSKSQQHLFAISQRRSLSEAVTDVLVERGDRDVVHSVVKNTGARFSDAGFRMLVKRSTGDDVLATEVGRAATSRARISCAAGEGLQRGARAACRRKSASRHRHRGVVAEVVGGIRNEARNASPDFAAAQAMSSGRTASAASAKPKSINTRATASSRRPRSRCRSCATRRSTSWSARCSIPAPKSC